MYQEQIINKRDNGDGSSECTIVAKDDAGTYPDVRVELHFSNTRPNQLTRQFLLSEIKKAEANAIKDKIIQAAQDKLAILSASRQAIDLTTAIATYKSAIINRLASNNIDAASLTAAISAQWTAYGVDGVIAVPTPTVIVADPIVGNNEIIG